MQRERQSPCQSRKIGAASERRNAIEPCLPPRRQPGEPYGCGSPASEHRLRLGAECRITGQPSRMSIEMESPRPGKAGRSREPRCGRKYLFAARREPYTPRRGREPPGEAKILPRPQGRNKTNCRVAAKPGRAARRNLCRPANRRLTAEPRQSAGRKLDRTALRCNAIEAQAGRCGQGNRRWGRRRGKRYCIGPGNFVAALRTERPTPINC